jgi:hypothetical protein
MATPKGLLIVAVATGAIALIAMLTMPEPPTLQQTQQGQINENPLAVLAGSLFSQDQGAEEFAWEDWAKRTDAALSMRNYHLGFAVLLGVLSANLAVASALKSASQTRTGKHT